MGTLTEALANTPDDWRYQRCTLGALIETFDETDTATITQWLADPTMTGTYIARVLESIGHTVGGSIVQRHRRGGCRC